MKKILTIIVAALITALPLTAQKQTSSSPLWERIPKAGEASSSSSQLQTSKAGENFLSLSQCLDLAVSNNRTLQNAALSIQSSSEQSKEAYTNYLPQISANVMAFQCFDKLLKGDGTYPDELSHLGDDFSSLVGQPYTISEFNRGYQAAATIALPLYAGGQIHNGNKLAKVGQEVSVLQKNLKEKDVRQKVTECYWNIATVKYNLQTIAAAEKQIEAVRSQVQDYVDAGMTNRNASLQVKLRQQELASNRLKLENAQHVLLMLLAQEIGKAGEDIDIVLPEESVQTLPVHIDCSEAANNRDELKLASKGVEAQQLQVKMERGKCLPTLAIGAMGFHYGLGGFSETVKSNFNTSATNGLAFGTLSIPISAWWGGSHAIRRQKLKLQQSQNDYLDAKEQLAIDVESSWSNLTEAYQQIDIAKSSVEEAEENLRLNTDQYKAGTSTITDLLDAETLNRKAHDQLSSAVATYNIRLADYNKKTK